MRAVSVAIVALTVALASATSLYAASPEQEKAFVDAYKTAFEAKDTKTLESFLYTKGSDPQVLEFYKAMQSSEAGEKVASIELVALTPEQVKDALEAKDGPGGKLVLPLKPSKKLVIKITIKDADSSSNSTSEVFIAEADGKLVIPVPIPMK